MVIMFAGALAVGKEIVLLNLISGYIMPLFQVMIFFFEFHYPFL